MGALDWLYAKSLSKSAAGPGADPSSLDRCLVVLGTGHRNFPSHTSKGRARTPLQLSEPGFSSNWDPPAPHLMVNAYGVARACSFCAQMLPVPIAIWRSLSDKLKPYVSCLSPASIHSYSDRVHGSNAPVAAHEAGEARPSGSLLSGGSREQQSERPARTAIPRQHPSITGSTRERERRTEVEDGRQTGLATPPRAPLLLLCSQLKEERGCLENKEMYQLQVPAFTAASLRRAEIPPDLTNHTRLRWELLGLWSSLLEGSKDVLLPR